MNSVQQDRVFKPVSDTSDISDKILFEDAKRPSEQFYLPRYRLAEHTVSGRSRFQISLEDSELGGSLKVNLTRYPAAEISSNAQNAQALAHDIKLLLRFKLAQGDATNVQKELGFQEVAIASDTAANTASDTASDTVSGTLTVSTLLELTQIYHALTEFNAETNLIVRRTFQVSEPVNHTPQIQKLKIAITTLQKDKARLEAQLKAQQSAPSRPKRFSWRDPAESGVAAGKNFQSLSLRCQGRDIILADIDFYSNVSLGNFFFYFSTDDRMGADILVRCSRTSFEVAKATRPGLHNNVVYKGKPRISGQRYSLQLPWNRIFGSVDSVETWLYSMETKDRLPDNRTNLTFVHSQCTGQANTVNSSTLVQQIEAKKQQIVQIESQIQQLQASPDSKVISHTLDEVIPFTFPGPLHEYIFQKLTSLAIGRSGLIRQQVRWQDQFYSYFQDEARPHIFYYLPDSFKLLRKSDSPYYPRVSVQFMIPNQSDGTVLATVEYWATAFVSAERLQFSALALKPLVSTPLPNDEIELQPLVVDEPSLFLNLQQSDGSLRKVERPDVAVDLRMGFQDAITLELNAFQSIFEAMLGGDTQLFQGQVRIDLPDGLTEFIPVTTKINDLVGKVFDVVEQTELSPGNLQLMLKNAIESPLRISSLNAFLHQNEKHIPATVEKYSRALPFELLPNETVTLDVSFSAEPSRDERPSVRFAQAGIEVLSDKEAIWTAILRPDIPAEYKRTIEVKTFSEIFGDQILAISIDFRRAGTIDLLHDASPEGLSAEVEVFSPISNLILRREDAGEYDYRVSVIRKDGKEFRDADWRTDFAETLWITSGKLPNFT
ncbi:MAG: hypothetical protein AAFS06_03595 [Cyanobacteria bacterium J06631_12]